MSRGTVAIIDLTALKHNFNLVKARLPQHPVVAMIKNNAYGHGAISVAKTLVEAEAFGVATMQEALSLREAGIQQEILLMAGFLQETELYLCFKHHLTPVIHSAYQLDILANHSHLGPIKVWLKVDTGMHRLGFDPSEVPEVYRRLQTMPIISKPIGMMTHLATADWLHSQMTQQQMQMFTDLARPYEGPKSIANSAFIMGDSQWVHEGEWLRPGIMLYGVSPFAGTTGEEYGLKPVMTLQSRIMSIKPLKVGDRVGYGCTWQCPEDMLMAIVSIGYGDGYPRSAKNGTPVLVNGVRCAVIGRVSMDMIAVDLRSCPQAKLGDQVVLWGNGLPVEEIAVNADGFSYEMLSGISGRVERNYILAQDPIEQVI